ncbi:MAG: sensor histidine kinase [Fusobacteriaceae bacterium]
MDLAFFKLFFSTLKTGFFEKAEKERRDFLFHRSVEELEKIELEKKKLVGIINSVDMAIVLTNKNFGIISKNKTLDYLFQPATTNNCLASIKHIEIINIIKNFLKNNRIKEKNKNQNIEKEISEEVYLISLKKHFLVTIKYFEESENYLIMIKDITFIKEISEIQKKFISNVSHELKTPLTNIKGYLIALEDSPQDKKAEFLNIIYKNINKLENLISDFLNLVKIENNSFLNIQDIKISKIKNSLTENLNGLIKNKNAKINFHGKFSKEYSEEIIKIDFDKIILILKNLVENGIIYNINQSPEINITFLEEEGKYKFIVSDNGIGISRENYKKIYERFYRVDEARTTNLSGSGLGLAIVKEIIQNFKGTIILESELGSGTTFVVEFFLQQ